MAALPVLWACSDRIQEDATLSEPSNPDFSYKILFKGAAQEGDTSFLVKFDKVLSESNLPDFLIDGVVGIEPYFPHMPGKEAMEARFGLDRWYKVTLSEGTDLDLAIEKMAAFSSVTTVEYPRKPYLIDLERETVPAVEIDTKATIGKELFNDPMLSDQWHYINYGNSKYGTGAVAGADVNVKDVWTRLTCGDPDIIVAVIDEGVKYTHPDLKDNMWVNTRFREMESTMTTTVISTIFTVITLSILRRMLNGVKMVIQVTEPTVPVPSPPSITTGAAYRVLPEEAVKKMVAAS